MQAIRVRVLERAGRIACRPPARRENYVGRGDAEVGGSLPNAVSANSQDRIPPGGIHGQPKTAPLTATRPEFDHERRLEAECSRMRYLRTRTAYERSEFERARGPTRTAQIESSESSTPIARVEGSELERVDGHLLDVSKLWGSLSFAPATHPTSTFEGKRTSVVERMTCSTDTSSLAMKTTASKR